MTPRKASALTHASRPPPRWAATTAGGMSRRAQSPLRTRKTLPYITAMSSSHRSTPRLASSAVEAIPPQWSMASMMRLTPQASADKCNCGRTHPKSVDGLPMTPTVESRAPALRPAALRPAAPRPTARRPSARSTTAARTIPTSVRQRRQRCSSRSGSVTLFSDTVSPNTVGGEDTSVVRTPRSW